MVGRQPECSQCIGAPCIGAWGGHSVADDEQKVADGLNGNDGFIYGWDGVRRLAARADRRMESGGMASTARNSKRRFRVGDGMEAPRPRDAGAVSGKAGM